MITSQRKQTLIKRWFLLQYFTYLVNNLTPYRIYLDMYDIVIYYKSLALTYMEKIVCKYSTENKRSLDDIRST